MKLKKISKKAQIGITLTWFVAFVIVFFVMLVFLALTALLAAEKSILSLGGILGGKNNIESQKNSDNLASQRKLFFLLNSPLDDKTVKEEIIEWKITDSEEIRNKVVSVVKESLKKQGSEDCSVFMADSGKIILNSFSSMDATDINTNKFSLDIFYNNQKVNAAAYSGKC